MAANSDAREIKAQTFAEKIKNWRKELPRKQAADVLGIDYPSFRKFACGKRTPGKYMRLELERRMEEKKNIQP